MARMFQLETEIKSVDSDNGQLKIVGYASTADTDRVGDVIIPGAWTVTGGLDNFKRNPIILFNHNYGAPIGKATNIEVDSVGLRIECSISQSAGDTYGLIKDGVLTTFSVGFAIRDADYNQTTDGYIIRDAELLEVSVVSVPCNQAAVFNISKSFKTEEDKTKFNEEVNAIKGHVEESQVTNVADGSTTPEGGVTTPPEKFEMNPEEMAAQVAKAVADALAAQKAAEVEATKKAADAAAAQEAVVKAAAIVVTKSVEEKLLSDFESKLKTNNDNFEKTIGEMKTALEEKSTELRAMVDSKRHFEDRGKSGGDVVDKHYGEVETAVLLAKLKNAQSRNMGMGPVGIVDTKFGKAMMEKFNTQSTVTVGTDRLETTVSTNIERDIQNQLILAPMFREITMNSAQMSFPIAPDAGYAEITSATTASGTQPNGNVDPRGAGYGAPYQGITLTEKLFSTVKMIGRGYLGNETEEDAIIPILPLIKDAMTRSHARGMENLILAGNTNQGVYTSGAANGLLKFASTANRTLTSPVGTPLTSATLFNMRRLMGKYGLDPRNITYIVSQDAYYQLIADPEFADADLVGAQANKLTGTVGRLYGSDVMMCDEFAPTGAGNYFALALNTTNFVIPRLRGMTVESWYDVDNQRTVLISSQRMGFDEIIPNAPSVVGLQYV